MLLIIVRRKEAKKKRGSHAKTQGRKGERPTRSKGDRKTRASRLTIHAAGSESGHRSRGLNRNRFNASIRTTSNQLNFWHDISLGRSLGFGILNAGQKTTSTHRGSMMTIKYDSWELHSIENYFIFTESNFRCRRVVRWNRRNGRVPSRPIP